MYKVCLGFVLLFCKLFNQLWGPSSCRHRLSSFFHPVFEVFPWRDYDCLLDGRLTDHCPFGNSNRMVGGFGIDGPCACPLRILTNEWWKSPRLALRHSISEHPHEWTHAGAEVCEDPEIALEDVEDTSPPNKEGAFGNRAKQYQVLFWNHWPLGEFVLPLKSCTVVQRRRRSMRQICSAGLGAMRLFSSGLPKLPKSMFLLRFCMKKWKCCVDIMSTEFQIWLQEPVVQERDEEENANIVCDIQATEDTLFRSASMSSSPK